MKPEDKDEVLCTVFTELKSLGVKVPKVKKFKSRISKQARPVSDVLVPSNKAFGVTLCEQEKVIFEDNLLPKFIVTATNYLKKFAEKEIGLFRKAGSVSRQKNLRIKLERGESIDDSGPHDVASLLKQWLRELPEPLIPVYLQDLFVRCQSLQSEDSRMPAVLLCCHLLPLDHFCTLKYLLDFLSDIATHCNKNKMGAHNLAVIMAPNIFVMKTESIDKSSSDLLQQHTSVIELLINNAHKVVAMPACSSSHLAEEEALKFSDDLDIALDTVDFTPCKSKKKRRSGTVQGLFSNIRKLVGQNSLSPTPSKRPNEDDPVSETRCASAKRKAPEQLSPMSPLKKQATASKVLRNESPKCTPSTKTNRSIFGIKEKTGGSHSRRKSFTLLRRKERKRHTSKSSLLADKQTVNTADLLKEDVKTALKKNEMDQSFQVISSPLLSPMDLENLFSETGFTKKSVSDCYLISTNKKISSSHDCKMLSSSSSDGCLHLNNCDKSYNLRSNDVSKKATKRKSDDLNNNEMKILVPTANNRVTEKGDKRHSYLSTSIESEINSPVAKRRSPKQVSFSSEIANPSSQLIDCDQNQNNSVLENSNQTDCVRISCTSIQNPNSQIINAENLNIVKSVSNSEKENYDASFSRGDVNSVNDTAPSVLITKPDDENSSASNVPKTERVKRNCSIHRQEAFIIKSKSSKKNTLNHLKRADSIKISKSRSIRMKNQIGSSESANRTSEKPNVTSTSYMNHQADNITSDKSALISTSKIISQMNNETGKSSDLNRLNKECTNAKNSINLVSISDKKRPRKNARNCSILRGRPNTLSSGLPPGPSSRYSNESNSGNPKHQTVSSTSSVDNNLFINVVKKSEENNNDLSITQHMQNMALSPKENVTQKSDCKNETSVESSEIKDVVDSGKRNSITTNTKEETNCDSSEVKTCVSSRRSQKITLRKKSRGRLSSNSDSKIHHRKKKKTSEVSRINSFPRTTMTLRPRIVQELRAEISSSPRRSLSPRRNISEKENLHTEEAQIQLNMNDLKTPENKAKSPIIWSSARSFFESETPAHDDIFCKRESIAMIVKNNRGHVRSKASLYENGSHTSTPIDSFNLVKGATPGDTFYTPSYNITQSNHSRRNTTSIRSNKSTRRKSPLPPPPRFFVSDSPASPSYPLKELTNISNSEDKQCSPSPLKKSLNTQINDSSSSKKNKKCTLKPKMKSYSGHTPFKLPVDRSRVSRSESSPMLQRGTTKLPRNLYESPAENNLEIRSGSSPALNKNSVSQVFKTKSCLSIEKLKSDQLVDEWHVEM